MALSLTIPHESMRATGKEIKDMEWVMKGSPIEMFIKASIKQEKSMDREGISGRQANSMMASGCKAIKRGMECGRVSREILI